MADTLNNRKVKCIRCGRRVKISETSKKGYCTRCLGELVIKGGEKGGRRKAGRAVMKKAFNEYAGKLN